MVALYRRAARVGARPSPCFGKLRSGCHKPFLSTACKTQDPPWNAVAHPARRFFLTRDDRHPECRPKQIRSAMTVLTHILRNAKCKQNFLQAVDCRENEEFMKNKFTRSNTVAIAMLGTLAIAIGCGGKVQGNIYEDNGGVVRIEFKSGGKAYVSTGPVTNSCTYAESGKTLTLTCEGDKTAFTVDDDGALNGPPGGFLTRLTKKK